MKVQNSNTYNLIEEQYFEAEKFVRQIVELIQPERIYSKGNFLLVVVSNKIQRPLSDYKLLIETTKPKDASLFYTLLNSSEFERHLDQGQLFIQVFV